MYCGAVYPKCLVSYLCGSHVNEQEGTGHTEKWKCFLNSMLYLENRVFVGGCVLSIEAMRDISGDFPGNHQGQGIFGCCCARSEYLCSFCRSVGV